MTENWIHFSSLTVALSLSTHAAPVAARSIRTLSSERWLPMQGGSRNERKTCSVKNLRPDLPSLTVALSLDSRTAGSCTRH